MRARSFTARTSLASNRATTATIPNIVRTPHWNQRRRVEGAVAIDAIVSRTSVPTLLTTVRGRAANYPLSGDIDA